MSLKQLSENPLIRMLAVIVMVAAGIRLVFWLLAPVWPYLLVALALVAVFVLAAWGFDETESERARIELEVRRAERRLHDVARDSFAAMLDEARAYDPRVK